MALPVLATQPVEPTVEQTGTLRLKSQAHSTATSAPTTTTNAQQTAQSTLSHLYLPVKYEHDGLTVVSRKQPVNADMLIHSFRPFLAELLNIISYTQLRRAEHDIQMSNYDILCNVLRQVAESLQLAIEPARLTQLIEQNQN